RKAAVSAATDPASASKASRSVSMSRPTTRAPNGVGRVVVRSAAASMARSLCGLSRVSVVAAANTPNPASARTRDCSDRVTGAFLRDLRFAVRLRLQAFELQRMLVVHAVEADVSGEDRRVEREDVRTQVRVVDVPHD